MKNTIEQKIVDAQQAASQANQALAALENEHETAQQQRTQKEHDMAAQFTAHRIERFENDFLQPIATAKERFEKSLDNPKDNPIDAWANYLTALNKASTEEVLNAHHQYAQQRTQYETLIAEITGINDQLAALKAKTEIIMPMAHRTNRNPNQQLFNTLTDEEILTCKELNSRLNEIAHQHNSEHHHPLDNLEHIPPAFLGVYPPKAPRMSVGSVSKWESRTFSQALQNLFDAVVTQAVADATTERGSHTQK